MPLIGQSVRDDAVFVTAGTILLAVLLGLLRAACSSSAASQAMAYLKEAMKAVRTWDGTAGDEVDIIVRERLQKQKVDHFRRMFQFLSIVFIPFTITVMYNILTHGPRLYTPAQDVAHLVMQGMATLIVIHPGALSRRTLDLFYTITLLFLATLIAPFACRPEFLFEALHIVAFAMAIATFLRRTDTHLVYILNFVVTLAACSSIWVHSQRVGRPIAMMTAQVLLSAFVTSIAQCLERGSVVMMRQCMEMQATKELLSAASTLLRSYCDVVVELDSEGVIVSHAIDLESFLLRGSSHNIQGRKLVDLMADEADQRKFTDQLGAPNPDSMGFAKALHVSMKDGNGKVLELELLWFQFRRLDEWPCYMVGIREFCDTVESPRGHRQHQVREAEDSNGNDDMDEEGFSLPETASVSASTLGEPVALAVVDASRDGVPVRGLSPGFCMRIGRLPPSTRLLRFVRDGDDFQDWLQRSANAISAGREAEGCGVRLRMPQGEMQATCRILPEELDQGDGAAIDIDRIRLRFSGIRLSHGHSRHSDAAGNQVPSHLKGTPVSLMKL